MIEKREVIKITPTDYFDDVKDSNTTVDDKELMVQLQYVNDEIKKADDLGQGNYIEWLMFSREVIIKELKLINLGFIHYVNKDVITKNLNNIEPKGSVKLIELERFQRSVPQEAKDKVMTVKEKDIFDEFIVVFTDFTGKDYKTKEEKEFVAKNRDPIIFGVFKEPKTGNVHHRFYFIADWIDEYCELTFDKLISQLKPYQYGEIDIDKILQPPIEIEKEMSKEGNKLLSKIMNFFK